MSDPEELRALRERDEMVSLAGRLVELADRLVRAEESLRYLSTYEKRPPEVIKDEFAYDRLLDFIHQVALVGLGQLDQTGYQ